MPLRSASPRGIDDSDGFTALLIVMVGAIPASVGIAVLRYRLYEIERLINRTLVYGVLTVLLAAACAATTLGLGAAVGAGSPWATAGATLAVAVCFRPCARRSKMRSTAASHGPDTTRCVASAASSRRCAQAGPRPKRWVEPVLRDVDPPGRGDALLRRQDAKAGDFAWGPRNIPHRYTVGPNGCTMLFLCTPAGFENLVREMSVPAESRTLPPASDEQPDFEMIARLRRSTTASCWREDLAARR